MLKFLFFLVLLCPTFGQITQSIVLPATGQAFNSSTPAQTGDCREELLLQNWNATVDNSQIAGNTSGSSRCGISIGYFAAQNAVVAYWVQANNGGMGPCTGNPSFVQLAPLPDKNIYIRVQKTLAGGAGLPAITFSFEAWDSAGNYLPVLGPGRTCTYTGLGGPAYANGDSVSDTASSHSSTIAFYRTYNALVALGTQMPVTSPASTTGLVLEWKFDNSLLDSSGNGYTATLANTPCGGNSCFTSTGTVQNLVVSRPQFSPTFWSDWVSMRTGVSNTLTGVQSFSQAAGSSVPTAWAWTQNTVSTGCTGGESVSITGPSTSTPSTTPTILGPLCFSLQVTDTNGNMATTLLTMGAVPYGSNGVIIPTNPKQTEIFGPMVAFGQNPWAYYDYFQQYMIGQQTTFQAAHNDFGWNTTGQGTVAYPFSGIGVSPGQAGTTLCGTTSCNGTTLTSSGLTFSVNDASKLPSLAHLPTWLLIGNTGTTFELVRITGTTATTGNATLTASYDGRGLSGNYVALGGYPNVVPAQSWAGNSTIIVGEYRVSGTSTLFSTDSQRPVCPAGVPGPTGAVTYSTGTVTLTGGSTTATFSGTAWTLDNIGSDVYGPGFVRISATHGGGTPFVFWAQIAHNPDGSPNVSVGAQTMVLSRPAPSGIDGAGFSYQITSHALYVSLEFTGSNGETARALQNGVGCESETAMFALAAHDVSSLDMVNVTGAKFSYKTFIGEATSNSLFTPNFYGVGLAARNFYLRSGYGPALTLANFVDENWVRDPELGDGYLGGQPLELGGGVVGAMADLVINGSTGLVWANVEAYGTMGEIQAQACNSTDTRDGGYLAGFLTLAANYDTNSTNRTAFKNALGLSSPSMLSRDQGCKRNASDGYSGSEVNSFSNSFAFTPLSVSSSPQPLTLTNGSTAVTGSGFTNGLAGVYPTYLGSVPGYCWGVDTVTLQVTNGASTATVISGSLSQQSLIYFYDGTNVGVFEYTVSGASVQLSGKWTGSSGTFSAMSTGGGEIVAGGQVVGGLGSILASIGIAPDNLANNQALENPWACKFNNSGSLTLFRPWDGTNGSGYYIGYYNVGQFGQQAFMFGVKTNQVNWATKNDSPTIANGYAAIAPLMGNWFNSFGFDSTNTKGTFYDTVYKACGAPGDVPAGAFNSIHTYQGCGSGGLNPGNAAVARVNSAEGGSAMIQYYLANPNPTTKAAVDNFYGAIYGNIAYCGAGVASTCDGITASTLTLADMNFYKWPGFFYGMGGFFGSSWPAIRAVSVVPTITTTCPMPGGTVGVFYSQTLTATGDTPFTWTIPTGSLPTGLSLSGAVISGTPVSAAMSSFTIQATNPAGASTNGPISCSITTTAIINNSGGGQISDGIH